MIGEFPAQRASNAENVSIWWRHHESFCHLFGWVIHASNSRSNITTTERCSMLTVCTCHTRFFDRKLFCLKHNAINICQAAGRSRLLRPGQANFVFWGRLLQGGHVCPGSLREFMVSFLAYISWHLLDFLDQCGSHEREYVFNFQWVQLWSNLDHYRRFGDLIKERCQISPFRQGFKYIKISNGFRISQ